MPTVGILGEDSCDHGAWTERIPEMKLDPKKQVTVDLKQNK
jgi:hypothetical protein